MRGNPLAAAFADDLPAIVKGVLTRPAGVDVATHDIRVVGVGPGAVETPINVSTMNDPAKMKTLDAAIATRTAESINDVCTS